MKRSGVAYSCSYALLTTLVDAHVNLPRMTSLRPGWSANCISWISLTMSHVLHRADPHWRVPLAVFLSRAGRGGRVCTKRSLRFFGHLYATIGRSKSSFVRSLASRMGKALFKRGCNGGRRELHLHTSGVLVCSWSATGALSLLVFKRASLDFWRTRSNCLATRPSE